MNRLQKVVISATLFIINMLLAGVLYFAKDLVTTSFLSVVLLVEGIIAACLAFGLTKESPETTDALQRVDSERVELERERDALQGSVQEAVRERERLNAQLGQVQTEAEQGRLEVTRLKASMRSQEEALNGVRRQLEETQTSQQQSELALQNRGAEAEQLRQLKSRADAEVAAAQQQLQEEVAGRGRAEQERQAMQERLRAVEARLPLLDHELANRSATLQAVLDSVPDVVIMIITPDLRPMLYNQAAVQLLGVDASDVNLLSALPKFGFYLPDRTTQAPSDVLPFMAALRGQTPDPVDLVVRNARRPAGVMVRAAARPFGDPASRSVVFVLQEARLVTPVASPVLAASPTVVIAGPAPQNGTASPSNVLEVPVAPPLPPPPSSAPALGPLRVLLVEDSAVNQKLGVRVIELTGHKATVAGSGLDALAAIEREEFDLVLMDLTMPGMGGIETTALIREQEGDSKKRVPIVAVTASSKEGSRERCLQWGMDGYIVKPLQPSKLEEVIQSLFKPVG